MDERANATEASKASTRNVGWEVIRRCCRGRAGTSCDVLCTANRVESALVLPVFRPTFICSAVSSLDSVPDRCVTATEGGASHNVWCTPLRQHVIAGGSS